jgi:hypothetical protein
MRRTSAFGTITSVFVAAITSSFLFGCTADTGGASSGSSSALTSGDGGAAAATACFVTYVDCLRGANADAATCRDGLHSCLPRPPHGGPGDHGADCDGDGGMRPPPPPPNGDGGAPPPPPDHDGDHGGPPPPPPDADGGGPRACFDALDACAAGSDAAAVCADDAVTCLDALPPPPHPPPHR